MEALEFRFDLQKLSDGRHQRHFHLDENFFESYEVSPIQLSSLEAVVELEKRFEIVSLSISIQGWMKASCDRCMTDIKLPLNHQESWLFKKAFSEGDDDDPEVELLENGQNEIDVKPYVYESAVLSIPMVRVYDCESEEERPCDEGVLERLDNSETEKNEAPKNTLWEQLKDLDLEAQ